mmetsp:Transcript_11308/g.22951  ORF Transcript_11308/g.22951 Transcript_11308/m.22951 type:complete len:248 (+) Transcript_11308:235-978(+)
MLACGHAYCRPCIGQHVATTQGEGRWPGCPLCKRQLDAAEVAACCPSDTADVTVMVAGGDDRSSTWWPWRWRGVPRSSAVPSATATTLSDAEMRTLGLRRCPRCRTPIEKIGGCDNMRCRCGCRFKWSEQPGGAAACQLAALARWGAEYMPACRGAEYMRAPLLAVVVVGGLTFTWAAGFVATGAALIAGSAACLTGRLGRKLQLGTAAGLLVLGSLGLLPMAALLLMAGGGLVAVLRALQWAITGV